MAQNSALGSRRTTDRIDDFGTLPVSFVTKQLADLCVIRCKAILNSILINLSQFPIRRTRLFLF
ncbi:MAG: hypothetical protein ACI9HY_002936 [Planctomycetaceae bacterium]|jgi:hypothetical protein